MEEIRELIDLSLKKLLHTRAEIERFLQEVEDPELGLLYGFVPSIISDGRRLGKNLGWTDRRTASRKYQRFCEEKLARNVPAESE